MLGSCCNENNSFGVTFTKSKTEVFKVTNRQIFSLTDFSLLSTSEMAQVASAKILVPLI